MARDGFDGISFLNDLGKAATRQWERSVKELRDGLGTDMDRAIDKTKNEGLLQGAIEVFDVFSPGNLTGEVADAFNLIPEDPGLKEMISGGVNLGCGGPIGIGLALKDAFDAVAACTSPNPGAVANMPSAAQTPMSPEEAKHRAMEEAKARAAERVREKVAAAEDHVAINRFLDHLGDRDGYCGCGFDDSVGLSKRKLMERLRELFGEGKTDKADAEIDRLLANKNLCFEDLIFLLMRKVIQQGQDEVKGMAGELRRVGEKNRGDRRELNEDIADMKHTFENTRDPAARERLANQIRAKEEDRDLTVEERMEPRAELAEQLKNALQKLSEMQQALSNVLNTQHETAMGAIRNIR